MICESCREEAARVCDAHAVRSYLTEAKTCARLIRSSCRHSDPDAETVREGLVGWVQEYDGGKKVIYDIDPRQVHDNGRPTYPVYRALDLSKLKGRA